jgi:diguanylate cyclase (GGDEF)-like protein
MAVDGREIPEAERRTINAETSGLLSQIASDQMVIWTVEPAEKEELFSNFHVPAIFPLKWHLTILGFIVVDNVTQHQMELFQFYCQFISMLLNMAHLYEEVQDQKEELNELTDILFIQNSRLAALNKVGIEIAATDDIEQICRIIVTTAVNEFPNRYAAILLQDEKSHELRVVASVGLDGLEGLHLGRKMDEKLKQSMDTGRIISHKSHTEPLQLGEHALSGWGVFPFKGRTECLGALIAEIGEEDISDSLALLLSHGAIIIDSVKLMDEKVKMNESLTIRTNELVLLNKRLEQLSVTDQLTGLFNRRHFQERLVIEMSRSNRYKQSLCLLMLDIDHFKNVNDTLGHAAGDEVVKEVSRRLVSHVRLSDLVVRHGGDEIVILLTDTNLESAKHKAEQLRRAINEQPIESQEGSINVSISVGVAVYPSTHVSRGEDLCNEADKALYRAKQGGRNRVVAAE